MSKSTKKEPVNSTVQRGERTLTGAPAIDYREASKGRISLEALPQSRGHGRDVPRRRRLTLAYGPVWLIGDHEIKIRGLVADTSR